LDVIDVIAHGLALRGSAIMRLRRGREGLALVEAASEMATANDLFDLETRTRTLLTFQAQWVHPVRGLEMARAGQVNARRLGSGIYDLLMVGNGVSCAIRVGEWDWALAQLDEWLQNDMQPSYRVELVADRAILAALRGQDTVELLGQLEPLLAGVSDPQFASYGRMAEAWVALAGDRLPDAVAAAREAVAVTSYFGPPGLPLAARAALWRGDAAAARDATEMLRAAAYYGAAVSADLVTAAAGLAALEGRAGEALAGYRDALGSWRSLGLAWDEALTTIDMATLLDPTTPEVGEAIEAARTILARLGAAPFLVRLEDRAAGRGRAERPRSGSLDGGVSAEVGEASRS
jgi:tetratricopeptide (TPR) repeat protein